MPDDEGLILAFDYGTRFIGLALGEQRSRLVRPLSSLECRTRQARWHDIDLAIQAWQPQRLLVGLALNKEGGEQMASHQCRNFARDLLRHTKRPIILIDERYTSLAADQQLREQGLAQKERRIREHALAAALLLEDYFNLPAEARQQLETLATVNPLHCHEVAHVQSATDA